MMSKGDEVHADTHQNKSIGVVFDEDSLSSSGLQRSRSRSSAGSSRSSGSGRRQRGSYRWRSRSASTSSSSLSGGRSSPRPRSRSHPRCHRRSSRCRCDSHHRYGRGRYRRSPPRRYRAYSRSYSRSPSSGRSSRHRSHRSRFSSSSRMSRRRFSRSPAASYRSRSRSSRCSANVTVNDKRGLLRDAEANATKLPSVEKRQLPESVTPILPEPEPKEVPTEPSARVRQNSESTLSQSDDEPEDMPSLKMSPKRKTISFSMNNSVAKPTVSLSSCGKVTARVDSFESRKPYGHWVPVRTRKTSVSHKRTHSKSHRV